MEKHLHLAGDIGGTKTILALFSSETGPRAPLYEASYASAAYTGLDAIIEEFFQQSKVAAAATACFGVAGPVREGRAVITKLPWQPDSSMLQATHGFRRALLINDLVATGYGLPHLAASEFLTLNQGRHAGEGAFGIIAPGTGLGEVIFTWDGSRYVAVPSEGGHTDFAPSSETESRLFDFLKQRYGHVSYDRICSGPGIRLIYDFLKSSQLAEEPPWLAEQLAITEDAAPIIVNGALDENKLCDICQKTMQLFVSALAAAAGNLALTGLTTGGIYLGGGITPRILPFLKEETFLTAFVSKGRMSYLLEDMPIKVILNPKAALIGAASHSLGLIFAAL